MKVNGDKVKRLRLGMGMSQHELAGKAGVSQKMVWNMENGIGEHRPASVLAVARALEVSVETLMDPKETPADPGPADPGAPQAAEGPVAEEDTPDGPAAEGPDEGLLETWKQTIYDGDPDNVGPW